MIPNLLYYYCYLGRLNLDGSLDDTDGGGGGDGCSLGERVGDEPYP